MRVGCIVAACLMLAACDAAPPGASETDPAKSDAAALAPPDSGFDYRYAFRLPANRIESVQESHARGCEQLGPARCRITAMRYRVQSNNAIDAVLTLTIDPTLARAFGKAATQTVTRAHGTMTTADIAGADAAGVAARGGSVLAKLREAQGDAAAQERGAISPDQKAQAAAKAARLASAIATIAEVDQGASESLATAPVVFRYVSGSAIPGAGASTDATLDAAGDTFLSSVAGLLVVLAGVGPWIALLLGGALLLRWLLGRSEPAPVPAPPPVPRHDGDPHRNVIQRWFQRDDVKENEPAG